MYQLDIEYPDGLPYEPISYSGQNETHLSIDDIVESDAEKVERANFFVCCICAMVVKDPVECDGCQSVFCGPCIQPWRANNKSCPKRCQGNEDVDISPMHRYVK